MILGVMEKFNIASTVSLKWHEHLDTWERYIMIDIIGENIIGKQYKLKRNHLIMASLKSVRCSSSTKVPSIDNSHSTCPKNNLHSWN